MFGCVHVWVGECTRVCMCVYVCIVFIWNLACGGVGVGTESQSKESFFKSLTLLFEAGSLIGLQIINLARLARLASHQALGMPKMSLILSPQFWDFKWALPCPAL